MRKNSLTVNKGLSLSQAQSISNLCNQKAKEIDSTLNNVNNYEKSVIISFDGISKKHVTFVGKPLPTDVVKLLTNKSELHACQAFLMENIKAKASLLDEIKKSKADISPVPVPESPKMDYVTKTPEVNEEFGWSQLSVSELSEYIEAEAYASHVGQFIHKGSQLEFLRNELPTVPPIEWMTIKDGEKTVVNIEKHHTSEQLLAVHEELAGLHRQYEQKVNYFKAKVKNLTTEENARIAKINADAQNEVEKTNKDKQMTYDTAIKSYNEKVRSIQAEFEKERQENIKEVAGMRINIDTRFQPTIDFFLSKLSNITE